MVGIWERRIKMTKKILNSMRLESRFKPFTHETIAIFLCEVFAIIKSHPFFSISTDPELPVILSPPMLLTEKVNFLRVLSDFLNLSDLNQAQ